MRRSKALFGSAAMTLALAAWASSAAYAQDAPPPPEEAPAASGSEEIVVTANKVQQRINDVAMSVQAASGKELTKLGITDTSQLTKVVPGFTFTPSFYGTPIYSIRGVGFQDTSLAAAPTVSVYSDEVPIPFSIMTSGAGLDVSRVEVLKGPQGVSFGSNATGGLVNYIANKPTDEFEAGATFSYSRFNTADLQGYVSGPLSDTLNYRVALRSLQAGPWQRSYTRDDEWGEKSMLQGRAALEWSPTESFSALLTFNGFIDKSDTQMPALQGIAVLSPTSGLDPRIRDYPVAPRDNRAADWGACVNDSPFNPPFITTPVGAVKPITSTDCEPARNDNDYISVSLRMDYDLTPDITLTSLSNYQKFNRNTYIEGDGTIYQDYESNQQGEVKTIYQELRVGGELGDGGNWVVGANYEKDETFDRFLQTYGGSTANPTALPGSVLCAAFNCTGLDLTGVPAFYLIPLGPTAPINIQETEAYAFYASGEYKLTDEFAIEAGVRYTSTKKNQQGCGLDGGDGSWSRVSQGIQNLLQVLNGTIPIGTYLAPGGVPGGLGVNLGPNACSTTGPGPLFHPQDFRDVLDEDNVSWKIGVNWKPVDGTLVYANVKQGYKQGAYPTVATSASSQLAPAVQESLLAYEVGLKSALFDDTLQLNVAAFYYDYEDKQLQGAVVDPVFGPLPKLVNIPESEIYGFEISAVWEPIEGLRLSPAVTYSKSKVLGCSGPEAPAGRDGCRGGQYFNFDGFSQLVNLTGQQFPFSPEWIAQIDVQYEWQVFDDMTGFVGFNVNYRDGTPGGFFNDDPVVGPGRNAQPFDIQFLDSYTLVDLRAGIQNENWSLQIWGRNITDEYYFNSSNHVNDVVVRYTGQPATYGFTLAYTY
jgi:outer membrane receptor protein involved in Fe transport